MPGNRALYDRSMEQSREAARQQNWDEALKQAVRALQEFPQDSDARSSAAVALFNTGKFPQAREQVVNGRPGYRYNSRGSSRPGAPPTACAAFVPAPSLNRISLPAPGA